MIYLAKDKKKEQKEVVQEADPLQELVRIGDLGRIIREMNLNNLLSNDLFEALRDVLAAYAEINARKFLDRFRTTTEQAASEQEQKEGGSDAGSANQRTE